MTARMSKRDRIGSDRSTFSLKFFCESYLPEIGLAAAITLHLAYSTISPHPYMQTGHYASLRYGYALLLHCLVYARPVLVVHLIELVD